MKLFYVFRPLAIWNILDIFDWVMNTIMIFNLNSTRKLSLRLHKTFFKMHTLELLNVMKIIHQGAKFYKDYTH